MDGHPLAVAIAAVRAEFEAQWADTRELQEEALRLRHRVLCAGCDERSCACAVEADGVRERSRHVLLRARRAGVVLGTVRLVLPAASDPARSLPMSPVCGPKMLGALPLATTGEISAFAIAPDRRAASGPAQALMHFGLLQGLVGISRYEGVTHWCAVMDRCLLRLLQLSGIMFEPLGPRVLHPGIGQPVACHLGSMLNRLRQERPQFWELITRDGRLLGDEAPARWRRELEPSEPL